MSNTTHRCRWCGARLVVSENWYPSLARHPHYKCIPCYIAKVSKPLEDLRSIADQYADELNAVENFHTGIVEGDVYVITNPAWGGYLKIGTAVSAESRLKNYQTSSPHRDFKLLYAAPFPDRKLAETIVHSLLDDHRVKGSEWFTCSLTQAVKAMNHAREQLTP